MVKVKVNKDNYYLDGILKTNLDNLKKDLKQDYDALIIISGRERFGKSTIAGQIAYYLDPTYNIDRCCFTAEQFQDAVKSSDKYQAIVFDEAHGYLNSRQSMSRFNIELVKVMAEMGFRNLFIIICLPNFFELDKYPAIHRSVSMVHVYKRSYFGAYNYSKKRKLYIKGKKTYDYHSVSPDFIGRFTKFFPIPKAEYDAKKLKSLTQMQQPKQVEAELRNRIKRAVLWMKEQGLTQQEIGDILGMTHQNVSVLQRKAQDIIL